MDGVRHDYTYASGQLLRESFTQGGTAYTLDFLYDQSGRPYMLYLTTTSGSTTVSAPYYYILNLQGDVIHLVNTSGAEVASYTYDSYGSPLTATGSLAAVNPLRYRGYYFDTETGFYYLQSRYYDPALGRFINADSYASTGQGFLGYNMFAYCKNSPVSHNDPNGKMMVCCVEAFSGGGRSAPTCVSSATPKHTVVPTCVSCAAPPHNHSSPQQDGVTFVLGGTARAAFGYSASLSVYCTFDTSGNVALYLSPGLGGGFPSASVSYFEGISFAPSSSALKDYGLTVGGGLSELVKVGGDFNLALNSDNHTAYPGITRNVGAGAAFPLPAEVHAELSYSIQVCQFNIVDFATSVCDIVFSIFE